MSDIHSADFTYETPGADLREGPELPVAEITDFNKSDVGKQYITPLGVRKKVVPGWAGPVEPGLENPLFDTAAQEKVLPRVVDDASFAKLPGGTKFIDPEGDLRFKPVANDADYAKLPEGAEFVDPEGNKRKKPKFEPVGLTAQMLYDMALTDKEKRKILERSYPGRVQEDSVHGLHVVDEDGTYRKPGYGLTALGGGALAAYAPVSLGVVGAIGGGVTGGLVGAGAGGAGGSILGQAFNDLILQVAGVYDRTPWDEGGNLMKAGALGAAGTGVGRGIATMVPAAKAGVSSVGQMLPTVAANFIGATVDPAATKLAREMAEKGVKVPPSAWAKEAPKLQHAVEVFDPAFRTQNVLKQSAEQHYEKGAQEILDELGVKVEGSILKPASAVPTQQAGEIVMARTLAESQAADDVLRQVLEARRVALGAGLPETVAQRELVNKAAEEARASAQRLIDAGFNSIRKDVDDAVKISKAGANGGDLWEAIGAKFQELRHGVGERAKKMYNEADTLAGGHLPNIGSLPRIASEFLEQLPGDFKSKYPDIVRKLEALAGKVDETTGEVIKEAVTPTFGQLHNLRSLLRGNADWYTLSSDLKNGTYKFFSKTVDDALHDAHAVPQLKAAAEALDRADAFYKTNMPIFDAQQIKAVMRGLEAGEPADPKNLFNIVVRDGHSDLTARIRDMVGPNLWAGVKAADTQVMLDNSRTHLPGVIDGKRFAREVLDRDKANMLEVVHGKEMADKLRAQARYIEQLDGRLPIQSQPGDGMLEVISRARQAADEAKKAAQSDPLKELTRGIKTVEKEFAQESAKMRAARRDDPLAFLYDKTTGAAAAVDKILVSEDLILATAAKFGEKSPEFNALRQVYVQRILQGGMNLAGELKDVAPQVQQLMFPGVSFSQMQTLSKEMSFLLGSNAFRRGGAGSSMSAFEKVEHPPLGSLRGVVKAVPGIGPLVDIPTRAVLTQYYKMLTNIMSSPATLRWIEKGITHGSEAERAAVRDVLRKHLQKGGAYGAGIGEALYQRSSDDKPKRPPRASIDPAALPPGRDLRELSRP